MPKQIKIKYDQPKFMTRKTRGICPLCNKHVLSMESHMKDKHLGQKIGYI